MHNSGCGATGTTPAYLRPFALFAYICGFTSSCVDIRFCINNKWKEHCDALINQGITDQKSWAYCGQQVISDVCGQDRFGVSPTELKFVCLFKDIISVNDNTNNEVE